MPRKPRVLPSWVIEASDRQAKKIAQNLENAANAKKARKEIKKQRDQHRSPPSIQYRPAKKRRLYNNSNNNNNNNSNNNNSNINQRPKPSTPPLEDRPDSIPSQHSLGVLSSPEPAQLQLNTMNLDNNKPLVRRKPKPKPKPKAKPKPQAKVKRKKAPAKKRKKRKNKNNLLLDTDEDEWSDSSGGSVGSLADFIIGDNNIMYTSVVNKRDSDDEYDPTADIMNRKRNRNFSFGSDADIDDDDDDLNSSIGSLMLNGSSYNSMIISSPPKQKRKGTRIVCDITPLCMYGAKCYQKNAQHLANYFHPWKK